MKTCRTCGVEFDGNNRWFCSRTCSNRAKGRGGMGYDVEGRCRIRCRDGSWMHFARALMCGHVGRVLTPAEHVHHINGDKTDDRLENLEIVTAREHFDIHRADLIAAIKRNAKLTPDQVEEIKGSRERTSVLARRFGVTDSAITFHRGALLKAHGRA